ncbi:MAG: antibiotic biosynthesis monooxygenase [Chloroflexota bacterium]
MYARMITVQILPGKLDEAIQLWKESVAPTTQNLTGFVNSRLYINRELNTVRTVSLWTTEADYKVSAQWNQTQTNKFTTFFAGPPTVETYELATDVNSTLREMFPDNQDQPE